MEPGDEWSCKMKVIFVLIHTKTSNTCLVINKEEQNQVARTKRKEIPVGVVGSN